MNLQECLSKMIAPGQLRPSKPYLGGVIQIHVTRACDKSCYNCTQGSNLGGKTYFMSPDMFELAIRSLEGYFGIRGCFGGNPALSPYFKDYCDILKKYVPFEQRGIWCNHPKGNGKLMAETFNPRYSNLNVHLDKEAEAEFKRDWPNCITVGLLQDSRHSPPWVAMKDLDVLPKFDSRYNLVGSQDNTEENRNDLIAGCDINQKWSASIGMFRGKLRAYFCEMAMAQSILHQEDEDYPDTGLPLFCECNGTKKIDTTNPTNKLYKTGIQCYCITNKKWWELGMQQYAGQVRWHCHSCGIPLRGYGELSQKDDEHGVEQASETHKNIYKPKRKNRRVELVTLNSQLSCGKLTAVNEYLQNSRK